MPDSAPESAAPSAPQDLVLNLQFVPTWARKPAETTFESRDADEAEHEPDAGREERRGRPPRREKDRGKRRRDERPERGEPPRPARKPPAPARLPVFIAFLPERHQLVAMVKRLHAAQKAYPLNYLAHLLLAKPEFHLVKIEARGEVTLWQFKPDGAIFTDQESLRAHAILSHLPAQYEEIVEQTDPPSGQFTCVGRCVLSGELLGPPNYHGYNERLIELHRTRFPHMRIDDYRACIELVRDPAVIEQWKEQVRTRRSYRPKDNPNAPLMSREDAILDYERRFLPGLMVSGKRFIMPATRIRELPDGPLRRQIEEAWQRENKNPFTMTLALRPAFRHMRLHLFKARGGETFVTAVAPKPIDPRYAVEPIRSMLELIHAHPGWTRAQLLEHLKPGVDPASEEAQALLSPLRWLVEKGHVIEFFDGSLAAPTPDAAARTADASGAESPA